MQETPVQSAICEPANNSTVNFDDDEITIKGYAFSGGGRGIFRVDISLDGGKSWINPKLENKGKWFYVVTTSKNWEYGKKQQLYNAQPF